jgi:hypothetical protein
VSLRTALLGLALSIVAVTGGSMTQGPEPTLASSPNTITSPDTTGDVGQFNSLVLDAVGHPVISYYDATNQRLKVLHCSNTDCSGTETSSSPDAGGSTSLALDASGYPVISYSAETGLKVLHCTNADCSGPQTPSSPDTSPYSGGASSLALDASGYPVISYLSSFYYPHLNVLHCTNADCSGVQTPTPVTYTRDGSTTSLTLDASGNPVISFTDPDTNLDLIHCGNPDCTGTVVQRGVDGYLKWNSSLALDGTGHPVLSYWDGADNLGELRVLHCNYADCGGGATLGTPETTGTVGEFSSLKLDANGLPVVSYYDRTNQQLKVLQCGNPSCTDGNRITAPDSSGNVGQYTSLALDTSGHPVVSYYDVAMGDLKVLTCGNVYNTCYNAEGSDSDGDGCPDGQEQQAGAGSESSGGQRNAKNPWDYFNPTLDGTNRSDDISLEVTHYGHDASPPGDPLYSTRYDRTPLMGGHPWQFGPPNGTIRSADITAAVLSYGHDCS